MHRLFAILVSGLVLCGCAAEADSSAPDDEPTDETADELSSSFTYRCTPTAPNGLANGWGVQYLRLSPTRATYGSAPQLTAGSGAIRAAYDPNYVAKSGIPYARYVYKRPAPHSGEYVEWKVEPEMRAGGKKMRDGALGGFAVLGSRVDYYGSAKYVCFRK